jgi:ferredoxin-NADP reductase
VGAHHGIAEGPRGGHATHLGTVARELGTGVSPHDPVGQPGQPGHLLREQSRIPGIPAVGDDQHHSIAAADGEPPAITVERLEDGEVSPYLTGELRAGDQLELRGPIGTWFAWEPSDGGPLLLIAGGSGIVPLRAILRQRQRTGSDVPARLLYSARTLADVIYRSELDHYRDSAEVTCTLTRSQPPGWTGYSGRVDAAMLATIAWPPAQQPLTFVCGPTRFVETVAANLLAAGYPSDRVKTERFGGT